MVLNFLINDEETYTIEEAIDKELLELGDWFEYKNDVYSLVGFCEGKFIAYKLKRDTREESSRSLPNGERYRLVTYDPFKYVYEWDGDKKACYYLSGGDRIKMVSGY